MNKKLFILFTIVLFLTAGDTSIGVWDYGEKKRFPRDITWKEEKISGHSYLIFYSETISFHSGVGGVGLSVIHAEHCHCKRVKK